MDLATIKKEVLIKLQDPDPNIIDRIDDFANEIVNKAIEEVEPESFKAIGSVTTASNQLVFTGGSVVVSVGDIITGGTSGAYATVTSVTVSTGAWGTSDAAGILGVTTQIGTFQSEAITSDGGGAFNIAGDSTAALCHTSMPTNFSGKLLFLGSSERDILQHNLDELMDLYPDMDTVGDVTDVAVEGNTIYYQGIPSTVETIPLCFRRNPTDMIALADEPDGIPSALHRDIIVCGAAMLAWDLIEDGIEGEKVNMLSQRYHYMHGIQLFHGWIAKRRRNRPVNSWRY